MGNALYYGDNLYVLKEHIDDASVDLIYLDPPFNSDARYNVLFHTPDGDPSGAQAEAFHDTWHWSDQAEAAFDAMMAVGGSAAEVLRALRAGLGNSDMMAYLANISIRLFEMRRVLKPTGSFYLHCDPTASHYIKILLDGIFGHENFRNEVIWKRTGAHGSSKRWGPVHDTILFYSAGEQYTWNKVHQAYEPGYIESKYRVQDQRGYFQDVSLTGPGTRKGESGRPWRKFDPTGKDRHWAVPAAIGEKIAGFEKMSTQEKLDALDAAGLIYWPKPRAGSDGFPRLKQYPGLGNPIQDVLTDISAINSQAAERIGYPTQKPKDLLRRIIEASSNKGDVVLDPFCGCGTTVHAAQELGRQWIGIDVAHYAVGVIEDRLRREFGKKLSFTITGRPTEIEGARELARRDKYQFQWWANWLVGVQNYREHRKGADRGIDGVVFFRNGPLGTGRVIVSVKGGDVVSPDMIRSLAGTVERERAELGLFVCLAEPSPKMRQEAAAIGLCKTAHGKFPRVQIATIEDLLEGKQPNLPPRYEVGPDELELRQSRKKQQGPQMAFTFGIRGAKKGDSVIYPAERYVSRIGFGQAS